MSRSQKVEHDLHRIESLKRNLHETGIPVAHGAVPEARKFESLQLPALIALGADESCILIHILEKIELLPLVVPEASDEIHRIEMGCP